MDIIGTIDISACAQVIANVYTNEFMPLAAVTGILGFGLLIMFILYMVSIQENSLLKDFLRRENQLNKYSNWKKDRKIMD